MSTDQNYGLVRNSTNQSSEKAIIASRIPSWDKATIRQNLDWLHQAGKLTDDQRDWSTIISVSDNSMSPQLASGGQLVIVELTDLEFRNECIGKVVALKLTTTPKTFLVGRLSKIKTGSYVLSHNNGPDFTVRFSSVYQCYQAVYALNIPIL